MRGQSHQAGVTSFDWGRGSGVGVVAEGGGKGGARVE